MYRNVLGVSLYFFTVSAERRQTGISSRKNRKTDRQI